MLTVIIVTLAQRHYTKNSFQHQSVANTAETINKKCNYFYINSNMLLMKEWIITSANTLAFLMLSKHLSVCFCPAFIPEAVNHSASDCSVCPLTRDWRYRAAERLRSCDGTFKSKWKVWNELAERWKPGGEENVVFCLWGTRFNPIGMNRERVKKQRLGKKRRELSHYGKELFVFYSALGGSAPFYLITISDTRVFKTTLISQFESLSVRL